MLDLRKLADWSEGSSRLYLFFLAMGSDMSLASEWWPSATGVLWTDAKIGKIFRRRERKIRAWRREMGKAGLLKIAPAEPDPQQYQVRIRNLWLALGESPERLRNGPARETESAGS